jgi:hypothetical protein
MVTNCARCITKPSLPDSVFCDGCLKIIKRFYADPARQRRVMSKIRNNWRHDPEGGEISRLSPKLRRFVLAAIDSVSDMRTETERNEAVRAMRENVPDLSVLAYDQIRSLNGEPSRFTTLSRPAAVRPLRSANTKNAATGRCGGAQSWTCKADRSGIGGNTPQDCDWPVCGCDPYADKVIAALQESGKLP